MFLNILTFDYLAQLGIFLDERGSEGPIGYPLATLVSDLCERSGLDGFKYSVRDLKGEVTGFATTNQHPMFTYVQALSEIFFFDPINRDGKIDFIHRGKEIVATIVEADLIADSDDDIKKRDGILPRRLDLSYMDLEGELDPTLQHSDRSWYINGLKDSIVETTVILTTNDAKRTIGVIHKTIIEEARGEIEFSLPIKYIRLCVGDCISFRGERMRIFSEEMDLYRQTYRASFDRTSNYYSFEEGVVPVTPAPIPAQPSDTYFEFLDIPPLAAKDDLLGFYASISGDNEAWSGAQIELSIDGGANYIDSDIFTGYVTMGELLTAMPDARQDVPDYHSTIQIKIYTHDAVLESATITEMLNRKNRAIIGDEIVSFGDVTQIDDTTWELSTFFRGRLHTEAVSHSIGERFVLLETGWLKFQEMESYQIGDTFDFRITSLNSNPPAITNETAVFNGNSQIEPPPSMLRAHRDGSGNILVRWLSTAIKGGKNGWSTSSNFEGFVVRVNGSPTETTNESLLVTDPGGEVTIQVEQKNSITGYGQTAEVILSA